MITANMLADDRSAQVRVSSTALDAQEGTGLCYVLLYCVCMIMCMGVCKRAVMVHACATHSPDRSRKNIKTICLAYF